MPRKSACFSNCQGLTRKTCKTNSNCRTVKSYERSGYKKTKSYCRLARKFRMHRNPRTKKCSMRSTK